MADNCRGDCTSRCFASCTNLCDNVCTSVCQNKCTSSCEVICGSSCDTTCIDSCSGSSMKLTKIRTYLDHASMRKVTTLLTSNHDGLFIYPGLNGKFTVHRITDDAILEQLSTAMYNNKTHGNSRRYKEENVDANPDDTYKEYRVYSIENIQRVLYEALVKAIPEDSTLLTLEDIQYLVFHNSELDKLYMDVLHWAWNNTDSYHHNLVKKPEEEAI